LANLFDDANAPETEPSTIVAGDQVKWKRTDLGTDYPNTAYSLRYSSRLEGTGSTTFDVASADSGLFDDHCARYDGEPVDRRLSLATIVANEAAKVVQRRMVPNFKKSFERAVRTERR